MGRVYLETSFVSACVSTRNDVASTYQRSVSMAWWHSGRAPHQVLISDAVVNELSDSRYPNRDAAFRFVEGVPVLAVTAQMLELAKVLVQRRVMPRPVGGDALHVAMATVAGIDFMLTWNVRHLANLRKAQILSDVCREFALVTPRILRPDDMMEMDDDAV